MSTIIIQNEASMNRTNNQLIGLPMKRILTWMVMLLLATMALETQAQCGNSALVCNNLVRVSLDTSCTYVITPSVLLKAGNLSFPGDTVDYYVEVYDPEGNIIPGDTITQDYGGQRLEVRVYCKQNDLYCWGNIIVEDKIKPIITITPQDTILSCIVMPFELDPNALITSVSFTDNGCVKPDTFSITDFTETVFPCRDTVKIIRRVFSTVDAAGNQCDTTQTIYLLRGELSEIGYPKDTLIDCLDEADLSPAKLGMPDIGSCEHFEISMNDVDIPTCGVARKILRRWTITDICTRNDTTVTQVIKIEDNNPPKFNFDNFDIPVDKVETDKFNCTANVRGINNPQVTDCNLAQTTLRIFYQLSDASGNLSGLPVAAAVNDMLSDPADPMTATMIWDLLDIPVQEYFRVIFIADDGCGNISRDTSAVFMLPDTSPPNAVCEGNTTVVLNTAGVTEVWAESFDDNSFDNCGIVSKEVRRFNGTCTGFASDEQFGDRIHFCCEDVANNPIKVVFRVSDASGGFSDCIINVFVQDKRPIGLTCGNDLRFNCGDDSTAIVNTILLNDPTVTWVCGEKSLTPDIPAWTLDECGETNFTVTWTAMDLNGQMATCTQNVFIGNLVDATVTRPDLSIDLASCGAGTHPDDIPNSRPIINDVDCENVAPTWEDEYFAGEGSACIKIVRTWTVIDWCKFDGGNIATGIIDQFEQTILISDNVAPTLTCPQTGIVQDDTDNTCDEQVFISVTAVDDCTPAQDITYSYAIDLNNDGTTDASEQGTNMTFVFPVGTHKVTFTAVDACGNPATCEVPVTITSSKAPIPLCVGLTEAVIGINGIATIEAASLNVKSTTGCSFSEEGLSFSFAPDQVIGEMTFDCDDIPNGVFAEETIDVWVIDNATGASAACPVIISISDRQNNVCPDNISASTLSGYVTDENDAVVHDIPVMAENLTTGEVLTTMTDDRGYYSFDDISSSVTYKINPQFDDYPLAGVSTLDIVLIQQHILGMRALDSPYKLQAADVNNSNSVSAIDLVALRLLILGKSDDLPKDNWKFVDKDFDFDMDNDPWTYQDHIMIENGQVDGQKNFIGMKVGDVNGNAFGALATGTAGPRSSTVFNVDASRRADVVRYNFSADEVSDLVGLQLAIDLEDDMELVVLGSDQLDLGGEHFSLINNELRISWSNETALDLDGETAFFIDVKVQGDDIPALVLSERAIHAEMYDDNLERSAIVLNNTTENVSGRLVLMQNQPNPFTDMTKISFQLPESESVDFNVSDINGKTLYRSTKIYNKGVNTIELSAEVFGSTGVYYYTIITATDKQTKRLILLN